MALKMTRNWAAPGGQLTKQPLASGLPGLRNGSRGPPLVLLAHALGVE